MRLAEDRFRVVTGGATDVRRPPDPPYLPPGAFLADLTSAWTTIGLWGPKARDVLAAVTASDVSHEAFPFRHLPGDRDRGMVALASRISYVGELGWELHVPIEQGCGCGTRYGRPGSRTGL